MRTLSLMLLIGVLTVSIQSSSSLQYEVNYGVAEMQGRRPTMEDEVDCTIDNDHAFFAVYDGHGGRYVATFAKDNLRVNCALHEAITKSEIHHALTTGFLQTNDELDELLSARTGSAATVAVIKDGQIYVANTGDSRTVLCSAAKAIPLSNDHKPDRDDERERIEDLGGEIIFRGVWRVNGRLALSRALGDKRLAPYIIPDPEITHKRLTAKDEFLILGCDGVWDVFDNQEAVDLVKVALSHNNYDYQAAAKALRDAAYDKGSADNITVIVVDLKPFIQE